MSQSITFFQFDAKAVNDFWQSCITDNFSISATQHVDGLSNIIRGIKSGEVTDYEKAFYEIDDLIVKHFSHRYYSEYASDINSALSFWVKTQIGKDFERDFGYDIEKIETETWGQLFSSPKKLTELKDLKEHDISHYEADLSVEDLLDIFLRIKTVYEYSDLSDTEMFALPEDLSLSTRWSQRQASLMPQVTVAMQKLLHDK